MYWILSKGISVKIDVKPNIANIRLNIDTNYQASLASLLDYFCQSSIFILILINDFMQINYCVKRLTVI